jgi:hypothetical protein
MRVEGCEQGRKALRVPSFLDGPPEGETSRSDLDVGIAMVRQVHEGGLAGERSTTVLPPAAIAALARLRRAENEYEQARARDWRRSVLSPGAVLPPLAWAGRPCG